MGVEVATGLELRRAKRARVYYAAQLAAFGRNHDIKALDMSPLGVMVQVDVVLKEGDEVRFIRGGAHTPARVIWTHRDKAGLEFIAPEPGACGAP